MRLKSPAFPAQGTIPKKFTGDGDDLSPPLEWSDVPKGTESLALVMDDPDAPPGTWVHWVLYDVPPKDKLPEGLPKSETLSDGAKQGASWGVDSYSRVGYWGPNPPPGKPHRYVFHLYALDRKLDLPSRRSKNNLLTAMKGHVLGEAELVGLYGR